MIGDSLPMQLIAIESLLFIPPEKVLTFLSATETNPTLSNLSIIIACLCCEGTFFKLANSSEEEGHKF
jgi:hypothetical protein